VPFKANQDRRQHIPKQRDRVTNWAAYDSALRQRGSLTVWFTEAAIAAWKAEPRGTRGGQPRYSALAITTALTLRAVFRLALRQTEGLVASMLRLLGLDLAAPDHSTMSRRGETLPVSQYDHLAGRLGVAHADALVGGGSLGARKRWRIGNRGGASSFLAGSVSTSMP
jgi:Transposase DDE domain